LSRTDRLGAVPRADPATIAADAASIRHHPGGRIRKTGVTGLSPGVLLIMVLMWLIAVGLPAVETALLQGLGAGRVGEDVLSEAHHHLDFPGAGEDPKGFITQCGVVLVESRVGATGQQRDRALRSAVERYVGVLYEIPPHRIGRVVPLADIFPYPVLDLGAPGLLQDPMQRLGPTACGAVCRAATWLSTLSEIVLSHDTEDADSEH